MTFKILLKLIFFIVIVSATNIKEEQKELFDKIKSKLQHNTYNAAHYNNYAKNIQTNVEVIKDTIKKKDLDIIKIKYQFTEEMMKNLLKSFSNSNSEIVELINFVKPVVNSTGTSTYMRHIGYAIKIDDSVTFVVIKAKTTCGFVQKKEIYKRKVCKGSGPYMKCNYVDDWRDRGYNPYELNQLSTALDVHNQVSIKSKIESINPTEIIITGQNRLYSASGIYSIGVKPNGFIAIYVNNTESGGFGKTYNVKYGPFSFVVKQNGDIIIRNDRGRLFWSAHTGGKGKFPYTMILTEDQNIVVIDSTNKPIWDKENKYSHRKCLMIQGYKLVSENKKYYSKVQNGLIYVFEKGSNKVTSEFGILSQGYFYAYLEDDGQLVIANYDKPIYIKTGYGVKDEYRFKVTNEGKFAIVNGEGNAVFTSQ